VASTFTNAVLKVTTADTPATLYTASGVKGIVNALNISNTTSSSIKVSITVVQSATTYSLGTNIPISAEASLIWDKPINLNDADFIQISCNTADSVDAFASVLEIS